MPRRPLRPVSFSRPTLASLRHARNPEHLKVCEECRSALRRERQYLERLRGSAVPEASQDLAARLIQHTERLANEPEHSAGSSLGRRAARRSLRLAGIAAGTVLVSAGALAVSAYVVAGDDQPQALAGFGNESPSSSSLTGGPAQPLAGFFFAAGTTVNLSTSQLDDLRAGGWACPELSDMGFHVVSAQATTVNGHPAVELRLERNGHYATIVEEHLPAPDPASPEGSTTAQLSLTQGKPWGAVYATPAAVITYASDLPADLANDAVPELVRAGESLVARPAGDAAETWSERLLRGLKALLRPAGL